MRAVAITFAFAAGGLLTACQPEPRSASYFEANASERAEVVADCRQGTHRGEECKNAQFAAEKAARQKTMNDYRSGF
ncbi:EexN family lipoprotein [Phenylobacterium sp. J426]|uniref:EexN family lipoprotein n=1 Tax=Phenylobacterium sp. J426 TaxID=2898439 RepID=UPI0035AED415